MSFKGILGLDNRAVPGVLAACTFSGNPRGLRGQQLATLRWD